MSTNKRVNKAYVRYDKSGRIIPGSLILNRIDPKVGNWQEIPAYKCCNPVPPTPSCNNFWINNVENPLSPNDLVAMGSAIDSKCNSFMLMNSYVTNPNDPNESSDQNIFLQKFDDNGTLIWEKGIDFMENYVDYSYIDAHTIAVDNDDNVLIFTVNSGLPTYNKTIGVIKLDNDGNYLWSVTLLSDRRTEAVIDVSFDSLNNIYISSFLQDGGFATVGIKKVSPSGVVLASKSTDICGEGFINVNSVGELYLVARNYCKSPRKYQIIKFDSSLNEIWNKTCDSPSETGSPSAPYGVALDKDENIVFQIGQFSQSSTNPLWGAFIKMSPNGDVIWTTRINNIINPNYSLSTYQLYSDSKGDIYISTTYSSPIPGYSGNINNTTVIAKISTDGVFQWAYALEGPSPIYNYYWYTPIVGNISNNSLLLAYYDNEDPYNCQLFKLPLTLLPDGAYGPYTVTNITNLWTTSSPAFPLSDETTIYTNAGTDVTPLTYVEFAQSSSITNIPL